MSILEAKKQMEVEEFEENENILKKTFWLIKLSEYLEKTTSILLYL